MYGWIWRSLPGTISAKLAESLVLLIGVLALLFFVLFPWVEPRLPWNDVNIDSPSVSQLAPSPSGSAAGSVLPGG